MAIVTGKNLKVDRPLGGVPFGNMSILQFVITLAAGIWAASNKATAIGIGDKLIIGTLPAGMMLVDSLSFINAGFTATSTMTLGFEYVDGVDSTDVPQDADFFNASALLTNAAIFRKTNVAPPVILPKDAYLIFTNGVAAQDATGAADIKIIGICDAS